ncbi:hypothetical protein SAMN06273572_10239 [Monaibacterium marinum]|uniref:Uncharacterized protein n=1 Tax=Pontivivens marinum TaxID=1690039 RepID=A0A2C9CQ64_9RHOB|nr:hypothetical protein [Monaibacterium marinum]SOH93363.1 hypothetical protein SAMN06273572_10239 [Monaibacterium marinum]
MFEITSDLARTMRRLGDIAEKQIPFAAARALTMTAQDIKERTGQKLDRVFDRPTPFTRRGLYIRAARKTQLTAEVGFKTIQSRYLALQESGGVQSPKRRAIVIPKRMRLNRYGNMTRGAVSKAAGKPDTFVASRAAKATAHLAPGIYQRPKRSKYRKGGAGNKNRGELKGPQLLVAFEGKAKYRPRLGFVQGGKQIAANRLGPNFSHALREAVRTAR